MRRLIVVTAVACMGMAACGDTQSGDAASPGAADMADAGDVGGDDAGGDDAGFNDTSEETGDDAAAQQDAPTFDDVFETVLTPQGCTSSYCHGGGVGGLTLSEPDTAYDNLVDAPVAGAGCSVEKLVVPGQPEQSLLWLKVTPDREVCGVKMPKGTERVSQESADLIYDWIAAGAPR